MQRNKNSFCLAVPSPQTPKTTTKPRRPPRPPSRPRIIAPPGAGTRPTPRPRPQPSRSTTRTPSVTVCERSKILKPMLEKCYNYYKFSTTLCNGFITYSTGH